MKARHIKILLLILVRIYIFHYPAVYAVNIIKGEAVKYTDQEIKQQEYAWVFEWLNKNTKRDEVVFANSELSSLIPVYTSNNVYSNGLAGLHFMPTQELQERFVINHYWDEMDKEYVIIHKFSVWGSYYQTLYDINQTKNKLRRWLMLPQKEYVKIPPEDINEFLEFAHDIKSKDFASQLKKYRVDYLLWDKLKDPHWKIEEQAFLMPLVEMNNIVIYKVHPVK
jgi:hypothetical protein